MKKVEKNFIHDKTKHKKKCDGKANHAHHPSGTIVTAPLDGRPISNEYLNNLVQMGGDSFYCIDREYLDKGPTTEDANIWQWGDSAGVRSNLNSLVSSHNNHNTTVIINTSSYITKGMVGCRIPGNYDDFTQAFADLDQLTNSFPNPRYCLHALTPRTIPENRGFNWRMDIYVDGLNYYYNLHNSLSTQNLKINFIEAIREWGYVKNKQDEGYTLTAWETDFLNNFESNYIDSSPSDMKYNDTALPLVHKKLFEDAANMIKAAIDRVCIGSIDELVISVEDLDVPTFVWNKRTESWINKDAYGNPVKFSWSRTILETGSNSIMKYHEEKYGIKDASKAKLGMGTKINYIFGTDEIPQLIYSRDLTRRTGFAAKFDDVNYSSSVGSTYSISDVKNYVGFYDVVTAQEAIDQRIAYVTRKTSPCRYETGVRCPSKQKGFQFFVHNSDAEKDGQKNLMDAGRAKTFARDVYNSYNIGKNVGVLDLRTNKADFKLFEALSLINDTSSACYQSGYSNNSIVQLASFSSWNTIGNSTGLGIAHAQVFSIIDYFRDSESKLKVKASWHSKILAQHMLEDALYNTQIKNAYNGNVDDTRAGLLSIMQSDVMYIDSNVNKPGGEYWIMKNFKNSNIRMRINNLTYYYSSASVTTATTPWYRVFECILDTDFSSSNIVNSLRHYDD